MENEMEATNYGDYIRAMMSKISFAVRQFAATLSWLLGLELRVFPRIRGYRFGGPHNKDCSILGSILGYPYVGKLLNCLVSCNL